MSQDSTPAASWDAVAAELRAYREHQQQTWGDLDHALLGRYLANEVSPAERSVVEAELANRPELRILTEVVGDVLADIDSVQTSTEQPLVLPFRKPVQRRSRYRQLASLAAAASLLLGLGFALQQESFTVGNSETELASLASTDLVAVRGFTPNPTCEIVDDHKVLTTTARDQLRKDVEELSRNHGVPIVVEAVRTLPELEKRSNARAKANFQNVRAKGDVRTANSYRNADQTVFMYICIDPPRAKVGDKLAAPSKPSVFYATDRKVMMLKSPAAPESLLEVNLRDAGAAAAAANER